MIIAFPNMMFDELKMANQKEKPIMSVHEAYAIIKEELDEFWDEAKKKKQDRSLSVLLVELVQIATMCWRSAIDLGLVEE